MSLSGLARSFGRLTAAGSILALVAMIGAADASAMGKGEPRETHEPDRPKFSLQTAAKAVGYINFFVTDDEGHSGEAFCNVVLVEEKLALTNHHCISSQVMCDSAEAVFTEDGTTVAGVYRCRKFHGSVEPDHDGMTGDYALLELEDVPGLYHGWLPIAKYRYREFTRAARAGMDIWRMHYDPPTLIKPAPVLSYVRCFGRIHKENPEFWRIPFIHPNDDREPCHGMQGQSGGAIISEYGELVGLTNGGIYEDEADKAATEESQRRTNIALNDHWPVEVRGPAIGPIVERFPQLKTQRRSPGPHYFTTIDAIDGIQYREKRR